MRPCRKSVPSHGHRGSRARTRRAPKRSSGLPANLPKIFADSKLISSRQARLSFYQSHRLMELEFVRDRGTERAFVLDGSRGTVWLNGESGPIHDTNDAESLALTKATAADYVRFFFYFLRADEAPSC